MTMPNPTATIFVPYHALDDAIDDPTIARTNQSNTFEGDQTIDGDLIVTGEINPTRLAEQMPKVRALEGRGVGETVGSRTLMSASLASGMSLRHDEDAGLGYVTVGNFDTQLYQPLLLQAESVQVSTGISPLIAEHLRVHPSGGVTVGDGADHATDPGLGVLHARGLGTTPLNTASLTPLPAARVLGRGSAAGGPPEPLLIGTGLTIDGSVLRTVPRRSLAGRYDYATVLTPPPLNGQVRMNALFPYTAVTQVYVSYQTRDNEDMYLDLAEPPARNAPHPAEPDRSHARARTAHDGGAGRRGGLVQDRRGLLRGRPGGAREQHHALDRGERAPDMTDVAERRRSDDEQTRTPDHRTTRGARHDTARPGAAGHRTADASDRGAAGSPGAAGASRAQAKSRAKAKALTMTITGARRAIGPGAARS